MSLAETIKKLESAIEKDDLEKKRQGNQDITYVPWYVIAQALNDHVPDWSYQLSEPLFFERTIKQGKDQQGNAQFHTISSVMVKATITIAGVSRQATGVEDLTGPNLGLYGDTFTNVSAAALRRCAALFGLGLFLYDKAETKEFLASSPAPQPRPAPQQARAPQTTATTPPAQSSPVSSSSQQDTPTADYVLALKELGLAYKELGIEDGPTKKVWSQYIAGVTEFTPKVFTVEKIQAVCTSLAQIKKGVPEGFAPERLAQIMRDTAAENGDVAIMIESLPLVVGEAEVKKQKAQTKKN